MEIEVINTDFEYPENLRNITEVQRNALQQRYEEHIHEGATGPSGRPTSELSPSRVMDINEISKIRESRRLARERMRQNFEPNAGDPVYDEESGRIVGRFVEGVGYVIDNNEESRHISKEEAREVEVAMKEREREAGMSDIARDIADRFANVI